MKALFLALGFLALIACTGKEKADAEQQKAESGKTHPEGALLVGYWTDPTPAEPGQIMIYTGKDGKSVVRTILDGDNGFYEFEVKESAEGGQRRFDYVQEMHGEYFTIDADGYLEFRNAEGDEFATGIPLEYPHSK